MATPPSNIEAGRARDLQGYSPGQLQYGTGGPKKIENVYTRGILENAFRSFQDVTIIEEERDITKALLTAVCLRHRPDRAQIVMRYCKAVEMFGLGPVALEAMNYLL